MMKFGDRRIPLIEKEVPEISTEEVTEAIAKHGAVWIRDPRWAGEKKRMERESMKAMKKLGWIK
jgi:hypothetical protein